MRAIRSFETSETTHPSTQDHISQDFRNVTVGTLNLEHRCTFAFCKRKCSWMLAVTGDDCTWSPGVLYFLLLGNKLDDSDIAQILGSGASPSVATTAAQLVAKVCRGRKCKIPRVLLFSTVTVTPKLLNNWCSLHRKLLVLQSQRERWRKEIRALSWSHIPVALPMETSNDISVDKKNQLDVTFCILYFSSNSCSTCFGQPRTNHQKLTTAWCYSLVLVCAVAAGRLSSPVCR